LAPPGSQEAVEVTWAVQGRGSAHPVDQPALSAATKGVCAVQFLLTRRPKTEMGLGAIPSPTWFLQMPFLGPQKPQNGR
jgi:hypothetical protein